jgi:hypothetical protein
VPDQPNPLTATTAAVHIMSVPSSHLLAAFVAMQQALGLEAEAQDGEPMRSTGRRRAPAMPRRVPRWPSWRAGSPPA